MSDRRGTQKRQAKTLGKKDCISSGDQEKDLSVRSSRLPREHQGQKNKKPSRTLLSESAQKVRQRWYGMKAGVARTTVGDTDGLFQAEAPNEF